ncbi:MAG: hypothetical protein QW350_05115 [Candidatus Aenigmatarchaeota archaeon]
MDETLWVPLYDNKVNPNDRPRKLTDSEIEEIVNQMPYGPSADRVSAETIRNCIMEWIRETLKEVQICPSAIPELIERIKEQHYKSLITPGTPVGIAAAEAVGATTTQMTLNTFHSSGSAKSASFGIEAMKDLLFARKNLKNEGCKIYFKNKTISYEEVLNYRSVIVGSMVSDFIKGYDIDSPQKLKRYWWHEYTEKLLNKELPNSSMVLRLFLNINEMYKHRVTIKKIGEVIESEDPKIVVVYGPMSDGIIDVYPSLEISESKTIKGKLKSLISQELSELTYFETVIIPELKNIKVKGISGIKSLIPVVIPVLRMVLYEVKSKNNQWLLYYNQSFMKSSGLSSENLIKLCKNAKIQIINEKEQYLVVEMPNDRYRLGNGDVILIKDNETYYKIEQNLIFKDLNHIYKEIINLEKTDDGYREKLDNSVYVYFKDIFNINGKTYRKVFNLILQDEIYYEKVQIDKNLIKELKPTEYIQDKISIDKRERNSKIKELLKVQSNVNIPRTELIKSAEFVIAETEGSNLIELLSLPFIDKTRTTCNNVHVIAKTFGIEAARVFLIKALYDTISNTGSYIHPMNIMLIAEFITNRGEPYGVTYTGISRQPGGHLSLATLERARGVFTQNALFGRKEDIHNVSASVAVGARMAIGNGYFDIIEEIKEGNKTKYIVNDDLFTTFESKKVEATTYFKGIFDVNESEKETDLINAFNEEVQVPIDDPIFGVAKQNTPVPLTIEKIKSEPVLKPLLTTGLIELKQIEIPKSKNISDQIDKLLEEYQNVEFEKLPEISEIVESSLTEIYKEPETMDINLLYNILKK